MKANRLFKGAQLILACAAVTALNTQDAFAKGEVPDGQVKVSQRFVHYTPGNPYLPLWEHVPDGEPKVFEDPDRPGHYRAYILGSHDVRFGSYCGPDIRMWSAPIDNLNEWRDEGPIFTFQAANGRWDVMYAPDIAEVIEKDEKGKDKKVYYLYPHSRGPRREAMVCKGNRPDGPFTPLNLDENQATTPESCVGFDPSVFIEKITDSNDPDYAKGFRAYCYWGFQHSTAAQLDQNTMYSVREPIADNKIDPFLPVGDGQQRRRGPQQQQNAAPVEVKYAIAEGQKASDFNFFEASSIRQVGNKYVMIFSGHSGTEYGLGSTNSALRYCYSDSPLGPWYSGGVAVDSRGVTLNKDGSALMTSNFAHNTHGSIEKIGDQWYIFYHRPARGFGNARQSMVAPVKIDVDERPCAEGGKVVLHGYDPYAPDQIWEAKASNGDYYAGAEVTSEGFNMYGLPPYAYYSAGYACFFTNNQALQDTWDVWSNEMIANVNAGDIIGYKYFGLGGLKKDSKGIPAFDGTTSKQHSSFDIWFASETEGGVTVKVMMDGPWANDTWKGKQIGKFKIPANGKKGEPMKYTLDVSEFVDDIDGKHAIYLVFDAAVDGAIGKFYGCGFETKTTSLKRPVPPTLNVKIGGKDIELPATPIRSTEENGIVNNCHYEMDYQLEPGQKTKVAVECLWSTMQFWVDQIKGDEGTAVITAEYLYPGTLSKQTKEYKIHIHK